MILLNAVTANTTGTAQRFATPMISVWVEGTLAGDVVTLEVARVGNSGDNTGVYVPIASVTTKGVTNIYIPGVFYLRAVLSSASGATITVATN